ncbi:glycosyltransferase [Flavobacterium silvisoli]|uniref:Glycosyltransferase n=1 Tax=Flavobacterium silvisoli TaxID=2529433 RepID=A0A4Q9Z913_9FLAO|nr:glycosyltransferase [Flavobacterium silvisoli]TBX70657.1 glycosyltransferase [Flavobacterium silvisoli]
METRYKNILVAPLNWGLGHATRCVPVIRELEKNGFTPIIASDGGALHMLQKEFPHLLSLELPSYNIEYAQNEDDFKWKLIKNSPKMISAIFTEKKLVKKWITEYNLQGIISDNRLGVHNKRIPSVIITHQLNVLSGDTTWISSKLHQHFIKKFTECWVPDIEGEPNLSGKLGHWKDKKKTVKYIGPLSRLERKELKEIYDLMIILSGPEPQRTILEQKLRTEIRTFKGKIIFIQGIIESEQKRERKRNAVYYNFMTSEEVERTFNKSKIVLCRSGYTSVMDLAKLNKKAFFIPTPGQYEQEYLAKKLKQDGFVPYAKQDDFKIENLLEVGLYNGLPLLRKDLNWAELFVLFERE